MAVPLTTRHCRTSSSPENLGWSNTSTQSETFGANSNGVFVKELAGSICAVDLFSASKNQTD